MLVLDSADFVLEIDFQGRFVAPAAPVNRFPGAVYLITRPWKLIYRGGWFHDPPLKIDFQGQINGLPLETMISSCERRGRVSRPPLKMVFYPSLQNVSAVVTSQGAIWSGLTVHRNPTPDRHWLSSLPRKQTEQEIFSLNPTENQSQYRHIP